MRKEVKEKLWTILQHRFTLAILGGIFVGSCFGLIALYFVKDYAGESYPWKETVSQSSSQGKNLSSLELPTFYVVQLGVFTNEANAEAKKKDRTSPETEAFIWERDGEYFLLYDIYLTESKAKKVAEALHKKKAEAFVKVWELKLNQPIAEETFQWYTNFFLTIEESIAALEKQKTIAPDSWKNLLASSFEDEKVTAIQNDIDQAIEKEGTSKITKRFVLELLYKVEKN